jgi:lipopolysaccharide biosynthesis protein
MAQEYSEEDDLAFIKAMVTYPNNDQHWLARAIQKTKADFPGEERIVFINAWNEWAEGGHLEPDRQYGHQFLEATLSAKEAPDNVPELYADSMVAYAPNMSLMDDIRTLLNKHGRYWLVTIKNKLKQSPAAMFLLRPLMRRTIR